MSNKTANADLLKEQLARLRQEFDSSFAEPIRSLDDRLGQLLCFSAGGAKFAIAMSGLQALARCPSLTQIPARAPALLGLAVVRAQIVPVYSLARLTGIGTQTTDCQWLALLHGAAPVALALDSLHGYAFETAVQPGTEDYPASGVSGFFEHHGSIHAVISAAAIYNTIAHIASENERDT